MGPSLIAESVAFSFGVLWLSALTRTHDTAMRPPGPALGLAIAGGVAWVLLSFPAMVWLVVAAGENAMPQGGAPADDQALVRATVAVALAVTLIGLAAVAAVRRGSRTLRWLILVALSQLAGSRRSSVPPATARASICTARRASQRTM